MDFLKIRERAKARAAAREADRAAAREGRPAGEAALRPASAAAGPPPAPDPVITDVDILEGELAARLQALPPAGDERFTTWRPGSGVPPVGLEPPAPPEPELRAEDFSIVSSLEAGLQGMAPASQRDPAPSGGRGAPEPGDPLDEFFYRSDEEAPALPVIGSAGEDGPADDADTAAREEYLTFLLGGEEYAVAIERVREVMKAPPITEVPRAPPHILGVVTVRGEVVAVFDPKRRLALPGAPPGEGQGRVVIVDAGEGPCGLLVDSVASVVRLRPGSIEARPQGIGGASAECLAGIGRAGERLFTVLDLGALLRRAAGRGAEEDGRHVGV